MKLKKILIIGGIGFVGNWIASSLSDLGVQVVVATRRRHNIKRLTLLPMVDIVNADVNQPDTLVALMHGVDAVINLVGILHDNDSKQPYGKRFAAAHFDLPKAIIAAMNQAGVGRLLHMSALKASIDAPSAYLRSKAAGEAVVLAAAKELNVTLFRPSVIFGPGDVFLNMFASLLKLFPVFPLASGRARFQPVYAGDVAHAFVSCLTDAATFGQTYELCGPKVYTLRELVEYTGELIGQRRVIIDLPDALASLQASCLGLLPNPPMSLDNLRSMQVDNVTEGRHDFPGWSPQALEALAPGYLSAIKLKRRLDGYRCRAGR